MKKILSILFLTLAITACTTDSTFWRPVEFELHPVHSNR